MLLLFLQNLAVANTATQPTGGSRRKRFRRLRSLLAHSLANFTNDDVDTFQEEVETYLEKEVTVENPKDAEIGLYLKAKQIQEQAQEFEEADIPDVVNNATTETSSKTTTYENFNKQYQITLAALEYIKLMQRLQAKEEEEFLIMILAHA